MLKRILIILLATTAVADSALAQTLNINQAAVDTLTKDMAAAVLANQSGEKSAEILRQLAGCGNGCDAVAIIKSVGGWDAVGVKMQELGRVKNTAQFQVLSPGDANAAIRQAFARFYAKYKADKNYGVPLNADVQARLLAKIDQILPPGAAPRSEPMAADQPADGAVDQSVTTEGNADVDTDAIRIEQLSRTVKEERENRIWMLVLGGIGGLCVIVATFYFWFSNVRELRSRKPRPRLPDSIIADDQT